MADQKIEDGAVLTTDSGVQLQCTGVRYQENAEGERFNHEYLFRSVDDLNAERKAAEEREAAIAENEARANEAALTGETSQGESENSPEGSEQKTAENNSLPLN